MVKKIVKKNKKVKGKTKEKTEEKPKKKSKKREEAEKDKKSKEEKIQNNKTIKIVLGISLLIILIVLFLYFYTQSQSYFNYKGIDFKTTKMGEGEDIILFYETLTFFGSSDGENSLFGFRIRTKPSKLKKIDFENLEEFDLMKLNAYSYEENKTFNCQGYGTIAMQNLKRLFSKMGMTFIQDPNATCDDKGRYNYFNIKYGDETGIKQVGERCYDIVIKGNDDACEVLPATEKLMVELFVKYGEL